MFAPQPINFRYGQPDPNDPGLQAVLQHVAQTNQFQNQQSLMQQDQANKLQLAANLRQGSPTSGQSFTNQNPMAQSITQAKQAWRGGAGIADEDLSPAQKQLENNPNFAFRDYQQTMQPIIQQKQQQMKQSATAKISQVKHQMLEQAGQQIHPDLLPEVASQVDDGITMPNQFAAKVTGAVRETQRRAQQGKEEQAKGQIWGQIHPVLQKYAPDVADELSPLVTDGHTSAAQIATRSQSAMRGVVKEKAADLKAFEKEHLGIDFDPTQPPTQFIGPDGKIDAKRHAVYMEWVQKHQELQQITHPQHSQQQPQSQGQDKPLDQQTAQQFYQQAGGDPAKARALAQQAGYSF